MSKVGDLLRKITKKKQVESSPPGTTSNPLAGPTPQGASESWRTPVSNQNLAGPTPQGASESWRTPTSSGGASGSSGTTPTPTIKPITQPTSQVIDTRQSGLTPFSQNLNAQQQFFQYQQQQANSPYKIIYNAQGMPVTVPNVNTTPKKTGQASPSIGPVTTNLKYYQPLVSENKYGTGLGELSPSAQYSGTSQNIYERQAFVGIDPRTGKEIYQRVKQPGYFVPTIAEEEQMKDFNRTIVLDNYENKVSSELQKDVDKYVDTRFDSYQKAVNSGSMSVEQATKLLEQDAMNYQNQVLNSPKYRQFETETIKQLERQGVSPQFTEAISEEFKSRKQRIIEKIENIPVLGSAKKAVEKFREYSRLTGGLGYVEGVGRLKTPGEGKALASALFNTGLTALEVIAVGGLARAGVNLGRQAIQRELAKRTSQNLDDLARAKITGVNIIEDSTGNFILRARQQSGNFVRQINIKGAIVKVGNSYSFIPNAQGESVVIGLTRANLSGVKGKTIETLSKLGGQGTAELFVMPESFNIGEASISRQVPYSFRGMQLSRASGIGVYTPELSSYARVSKRTMGTLRNQLTTNIKVGGDPIVSSLSNLQIASKTGKASIGVSKQSTFLNLLTSPKKSTAFGIFKPLKKRAPSEIISITKKAYKEKYLKNLFELEKTAAKKRIIDLKGVDKLDDVLIGDGKQLQVLKPLKKKVRVNPQVFETLQEGFIGSTPRLSKPFAFSGTRSALGRTALTSGLTLLGTKTASALASTTAVKTATLQKSLTSQAFRTAQVSRTITKQATATKSAQVSASLVSPLIGGVGGFGAFRPFGGARPIRPSLPGLGGGKGSTQPRTKKKDEYVLEQTGFGLISGRKPTKRKKLSQITGFEILR